MSTEFNSGVQMSLNGNLEVFPLEEVLRLLARSRKSGCLRVDSAGNQGRIFLSNGALSLATTANDVELRKKLVASGLVDEAAVRKIELSGNSVASSLGEDVSVNEWSDFVREESVEGLYRIRRSGRGSFDFVVDLAPRYPTGQSFDSEVVLSEADRRALEWEDIETVLPRLDTTVRMVPSLDGDESITLGPATWQILAALAGGSSTSQVAQKLQWSEFRTAREMATLVRNGLVFAGDEVATGAAPIADEEIEVAELESVDGPVEDVAADESSVEQTATEEFDAEVSEEADDAFVFGGVAPDSVSEDGAPSGTATWDTDEPVADASESFETAPIDETSEVAPEEGWDDRADEVAEQPEHLDEEPVAAAQTEAEPEPEPSETEQPAVSSWWGDEPGEAAQEEEPDSQWGAAPWKAEAPAEESVIEATPWGSPVSEAADAVGRHEDADGHEAEVERLEDDAAAETEAEPSGESQGWWAETMGAAEEKHTDPDSEADRFLESVFSSLSNNDEEKSDEDEAPDETGFGMGLLRRRRMGATARDVDDDR